MHEREVEMGMLKRTDRSLVRVMCRVRLMGRKRIKVLMEILGSEEVRITLLVQAVCQWCVGHV